MAEVHVAVEALDAIEELPSDERERTKERLEKAGDDPERYLNHLKGSDLFAVRIGDYRALVEWAADEDRLYVVAFGHRRNVYDREL